MVFARELGATKRRIRIFLKHARYNYLCIIMAVIVG